jgi:glutathione-regulated potassium-efflux system protein KefB
MLAAGVALGPFGFEIAHDVERLRNFTELGVVLLMFTIGLEMEPQKLWAMRRLVFGLGLLQLIGTALLIGAFVWLRDGGFTLSVLGGLGLALSSTAIGVQLLKERGQMQTPHGRASFAVLLFQDLAIVPLLALVPLLSGSAENTEPSLTVRLIRVVLVLACVFAIGRWILPRALRLQQGFDNSRGFGALVFLAILGSAVAAEWAGLSMALGAFLTGMMLSGSEFQPRIDKIVHPLRRAVLDLFFIAVGMSIDLKLLAERGLRTATTVLIIVALKSLALYTLGRCFRLGHRGSLHMAALLSQAGEFGFVLFGAAVAAGIGNRYVFNIGVLVIALSMTLTPLLLKLADALAQPPSPVRAPS